MFNILAYIDKGTHSIFYVSLAIPDVSKVHYGGGGILFPLRMPLMILKRLLSFSESPPTIMPWLEDYGLKKKKKKASKPQCLSLSLQVAWNTKQKTFLYCM